MKETARHPDATSLDEVVRGIREIDAATLTARERGVKNEIV